MDTDRRVLQVGTAVIVCALLLRLLSGSVTKTGKISPVKQTAARVILFLETGRLWESPAEPIAQTLPQQPTEAATQPEEPEAVKTPVSFSPEDASLVSLRNTSNFSVDIAAALQSPLSWDLTGENPTVLIIHTHGTESYVNSEGYTESSPYRTLDTGYNVVSVGDRLAEALTQRGISVLHDPTLHDYPSYNGSYNLARETVSRYLAQYPSIRLVLDLHRDAVTDAGGDQVGYSLSTDAGSAAKMMLVLGSDTAGLSHPNWQENFSLGVKLHAQLEKIQPGICRDLSLRASRFNQDLMPGMVLVEMGAAGNTRQEALLSADILAQAISGLA